MQTQISVGGGLLLLYFCFLYIDIEIYVFRCIFLAPYEYKQNSQKKNIIKYILVYI